MNGEDTYDARNMADYYWKKREEIPAEYLAKLPQVVQVAYADYIQARAVMDALVEAL